MPGTSHTMQTEANPPEADFNNHLRTAESRNREAAAASPPIPILFLRQKGSPLSASTDDISPTVHSPPAPDKYAAAFSLPIFDSHFLPVLSHDDTINLDALTTILRTRSSEFCAVIATSQRAVGALIRALERCSNQGGTEDKVIATWRTKPVYVVGKATASAALDAGLFTIGGDAGTAATLAEMIIKHGCHGTIQAGNHVQPKHLFLAGDKARDVLPIRLSEAGVAYEQIVVYETKPSATFHADLDNIRLETGAGQRPWVVFFSPSGVDVALEAIRKSPVWGEARVASIGPTTSRRLWEVGLVVDAEAGRPGPEGLMEVVRCALGGRNRDDLP
ncbi:tetrapyrrole biosynthesis, uroporphyrinogen III synthase [Fimicolochytrium jonesii]|uniref:tetrapyrrole biosynthesis, uroporphyrinogen III synthase n=1 Tax=Fimicolochytrium jonesii TaxID=1396493 RepID=UPI0022FE7A40|nr:tetrapyrrole biosynthesis, uroporphyrinogen III synthase [Fimicolochytrium jonesii]KAI8822009.1 tetrapyrrole biosynthesis, uroporphyrinogen III synthase [Fimicolochytrium jonesii]